jgi:Ser/Thr protein kinase RdoA (MazF antagonist)
VESPSGPMAVKWYNSEQSTEEQKAAIRYLVQTGPPRNPPARASGSSGRKTLSRRRRIRVSAI